MFNMIPDLARVQCPTLVMGGEEDPMTPVECQADVASALAPHLARFERFPGCGHAVVPDARLQSTAAMRRHAERRRRTDPC
jgi:proline iminopeptidase